MSEDHLNERLTAAARRAEAEMEAEIAAAARSREPSTGPTAVYSIRLPVDRIEDLQDLAAERGMPPTALMRNWVLARLDAARGIDAHTKQWEQDLRAATDRLRELLDERP